MTAPRLPCSTRVRGNDLSHEPSSSCVHWWRLVCSDRTGARRSAASGAVIREHQGVGCEGTLYQSRDVAFAFKQDDIQLIRRRMVIEVSASPPVRP